LGKSHAEKQKGKPRHTEKENVNREQSFRQKTHKIAEKGKKARSCANSKRKMIGRKKTDQRAKMVLKPKMTLRKKEEPHRLQYSKKRGSTGWSGRGPQKFLGKSKNESGEGNSGVLSRGKGLLRKRESIKGAQHARMLDVC